MNNRQSNSVFGITTIAEYLAFSEEAVHAFSDVQANVVRGFSAVLALNHVPDWLQYKLTVEQRKILLLKSARQGDEVKTEFESKNADLTMIRKLANGFKHLSPTDPTGKIKGYGNGPFGVGPFGTPYLSIDLGQDKAPSDRWVVGLDLCQRVLKWWAGELRPALPNSGGRGTEEHE